MKIALSIGLTVLLLLAFLLHSENARLSLECRTLEARLKNIEGEQLVVRSDINFLQESESNNVALFEKHQSTLSSLLRSSAKDIKTMDLFSEVLKRHDDWLAANTNRLSRRP